MTHPNYGYYSERVEVHLRSDVVDTIDSLVSQKNDYTTRQAVIRAAIEHFIDRFKRLETLARR